MSHDHQVVVLKIRCSNPNKKKERNVNRNMLKYIATREGVDLTPLPSSRFQRLDNDEVANLRYIHQRPRSHGLFGNLPDAEIDDLDGLCKKMYKISNCTPVYNIILSLKEEDAIPLGYDKKQAWADLLHASMPDVAQSLGIPITQLSWVAAYHQEKGHPHIHAQFWRNDGKIQSSYIPQDRPNKCKEIFSSYIFSPYRPEIIVKKTQSRDILVGMTKEVMGFIPGAASGGGIMGHLKNEFLNEFTNDLIELSKILPENGQIKYMLLPLELKHITNDIVRKLLSTSAFASEYQKFKDEKTRLSKSYSVGHDKEATQMTEAEKDLQKRMANVILKKAHSIRLSGIIEPTPENITSENGVPEEIVLEGSKTTRSGDGQKETNENTPPIIEIHDEPYDEGADDPNHSNWNCKNYTNEYTPKPMANTPPITEFYEETDEEEPDDKNYRHRNRKNDADENTKSNFWTKDYKKAKKMLYTWSTNNMDANSKDDIQNEVISILNSEAQNNNPLAMMDLGWIYEKGVMNLDKLNDLSEKNYFYGFTTMCNQYQELSATSNKFLKSYLSYRIGKCYTIGTGVAKDSQEAKMWFRKSLACDPDNPSPYTQYSLAQNYVNELKLTEELKKHDPSKQHDEPDFDFGKEEIIDLLAAASTANPFAAYELGSYYQEGYIVEMNKELAYTYFKTALAGFIAISKANPSDSIYYKIGKMFLKGFGTDVSIQEAINNFTLAAALKNEYAIQQLAKLYLDATLNNKDKPVIKMIDIDNVILQLKELTEIEITTDANRITQANAKYYLGRLYMKNEAEFFNPTLGLEYMIQAATMKNEYALYELTNMYLFYNQQEPSDNTIPMLTNMPKIISLLEDLAKSERQNAGSMALYYLGRIYQKRDDIYFDITRGISYLMQSAQMDNKNALFQLAKIYIYTPESELPPLEMSTVKALFNKFMNNNSTYPHTDEEIIQAKYYYGLIHLKKESPDFNISVGINYLTEAADGNNIYAQASLGSLYLWGKYGVKDTHLGKEWLTKSAEQGNEHAKEQLELYERVLTGNYIYLGYSLAKSLFDTLSNSRHFYGTDEYATKSKKFQKELKHKNPYKNLNNELE